MIANCETVNNYHMETIFDKVNNKLIYDRKLKLEVVMQYMD